MKLKYAFLALIIVTLAFTACKKDQTCTCTTSKTATADGEPFPLYSPTSEVNSYEKKLKDSERAEWCDSYEDSASYNGFKDGFNFLVFEKTECSI